MVPSVLSPDVLMITYRLRDTHRGKTERQSLNTGGRWTVAHARITALFCKGGQVRLPRLLKLHKALDSYPRNKREPFKGR